MHLDPLYNAPGIIQNFQYVHIVKRHLNKSATQQQQLAKQQSYYP